jgi:type I restriction-modification system DNA methylase subunit
MNSKEECKRAVKALLDKYVSLEKSGELDKKYGRGKEANTKKDFILPLFKALNWDVDDSKEVSAEESVLKGKVDYGFFIENVSKFFVEAKSIGEQLEDKYKKQAIEYGFNSGVTWVVLTNFKELIIFNCEWKEKELWKSQLPLKVDIFELYENFDQLWFLSKDSFIDNALDRFGDSIGKRRPRRRVDEELLKSLLDWRRRMSNDISKNYGLHYSKEDVDELVQRLLVRLLFVRHCEDRRFEDLYLWNVFQKFKTEKKSISKSLFKVFRKYDDNYDSRMFEEGELDKISIDDSVLQKVLFGLYYTEDGFCYDFSMIPPDIMGRLYEQYLGHVLKNGKLKEGVAHRKEQGIYYTPPYIVDYIVKNTLGELLKDKKVDAEKIRVLDPACGSGSFLIKSFQVLDEYYSRYDKSYGQARFDPSSGEAFTRKVKILQNNIFGVDLDPRAIDLAELNLLLEAAAQRKTLPILRNNLRVGNSLIDDGDVAGERAFIWEQRFKKIVVDEKGFDVVIGNPPYIRQEEFSEIKPYLQKKYEVYQGTADLFVYFFEQEIAKLKDGGYFGMIVSNKWMRAGYGANLRKFISKFWIETLIDFGDSKIFPDATIYPCVIIIKKIKKSNPKIRVCKISDLNFSSLDKYVEKNYFKINQQELGENEWNFKSAEESKLLKKIVSSGIPLEKYTQGKIYRGILTGLNEAFVIDEKTRNQLISEDSRCEEIIKPYLTGSEIKRYAINSKKKFIILTKIGVEINKYSAIKKWLSKFQTNLEKRYDKGDYWYELRTCAYYAEFDKPKIVWGNLTTKASFCFDKQGFYVNAPACILPTDSKYILGILNSKLMSYFLKSICAERQGGFIEQKPVYVSKIPIKQLPEPQQQPIIRLVDKMLSLNKRLSSLAGKDTDEAKKLKNEIADTDAEIDDLVYKIYGITDKERKIIEDSLKPPKRL